MNFRKFEGLAARLERGLTEFEERIQKFVDTSENESRQKCEFFDQISNKEMKQICFDHNFSKDTERELQVLSLERRQKSANIFEKML